MGKVMGVLGKQWWLASLIVFGYKHGDRLNVMFGFKHDDGQGCSDVNSQSAYMLPPKWTRASKYGTRPRRSEVCGKSESAAYNVERRCSHSAPESVHALPRRAASTRKISRVLKHRSVQECVSWLYDHHLDLSMFSTVIPGERMYLVQAWTLQLHRLHLAQPHNKNTDSFLQ